MEYSTLAPVVAIAIGSLLVGISIGAWYVLNLFKRNPRFHYINAEAEVRAIALITQLRKLQKDNE